MTEEIVTYRGYDIKIVRDEIMDNPREMDEHLGTMVCFHRRYRLGDEDHEFSSPEDLEKFLEYGENYKDIFEFLDDFPEVLNLEIDESFTPFYLPMYLYDHSGITVNTDGFGCPWDSGQVGYIFITREDAAEAWDEVSDVEELEARAIKCMKAEVEQYDYFLRGEVYGFVIETEDPTFDILDSCYGFYGDPERSGLLDEAKSFIDHHIAEKQKKRGAKLKELIRNGVPLHHREHILNNI